MEVQTDDIETKKVHHNLAQIEYLLVQAYVTFLVWGRGTGKSKPIAHRLKECLDLMPRCVVRFSAYTYEGMLNSVLPGIIDSWENDYGLYEGVHFWVNRWPPKELKIPRPYAPPQGNGMHTISWYNGSVIMLTSMDRALYNGSNFDAFVGDEVRLSKRARYSELLKAMRGNRAHFKDCHLHGSTMFATDRPQDQSGDWIYKYAEQQTPELIKAIMMIAKKESNLMLKLRELTGDEREEAEKTLADYAKWLSQMRRQAVHFIEASTLENIHALGAEYILRTKLDSTPFEYNTAILNLPLDNVEDGFYALLDNRHEYHAPDYDYQDTVKDQHRGTAKKNWRWYRDYNVQKPLHIACDHNHAINWIVTGQPFISHRELKVQSSIYVKKPDYVKQLIEQWCEFYKDYPCKKVIYYYDSTHIKGTSTGDKTEVEVVLETLKAHKWRVTTEYLSNPSFHNSRYFLWQSALKGDDERLLTPTFNASTNQMLLRGMKQAGVLRQYGQYKKDKSSEKKDSKGNYAVPQELATHGSEACDVLMTGVNRRRFKTTKAFFSALSA